MSAGRPDFSRKRSRDADSDTPAAGNPVKDFLVALANLGDPHAKISFEDELKLCCHDITSLWTLEQAAMTSAVTECLLGLPHKTSNYVLLMGLLCRDHRDIATSIVHGLCSAILVEDKPWWTDGQVLRVFSELATIRVVSTATLMQMIDQYLAALPDQRALYSLHYALPFALRLLSAEQGLRLQEIVAKIDGAFSQLDASQAAGGVALKLDYGGSFKKIVSGYDSSPLIKVSPIEDSDGAIDAPLPASFSFSAEKGPVGAADLLQKTLVLDEAFVDSWEETVLYRHVFHLLSCSSFNVRKCCEFLFAAVPESIGSPEKVVAQSLFGALASPQHRMQAEFVLIAACRHSKLFPSAMARCLFKLVDDMERTRVDHFYARAVASWFALHLSTFDFKWPWDEWRSVAELPEHSGKSLFVSFTLEYLGRLSYHEKLVASVPGFLHALLPAPPAPCASFEQDPEFLALVAAIKAKKDGHEIVGTLGEPDARVKFVEAVLLVGSKSFSHVSILLERYTDILKTVSQDDPHRFLSTIGSFWQNQVINAELIVGKLLNAKVLAPQVFVEWAMLGLEDAINNSSMTLFCALNRFLPSSILFSEALAGHLYLAADMLRSMASSVVADRQTIELLEDISKSLK